MISSSERSTIFNMTSNAALLAANRVYVPSPFNMSEMTGLISMKLQSVENCEAVNVKGVSFEQIVSAMVCAEAGVGDGVTGASVGTGLGGRVAPGVGGGVGDALGGRVAACRFRNLLSASVFSAAVAAAAPPLRSKAEQQANE